MDNHFLVETIWVIYTYGIRILAWGLAISFLILIVGSGCGRRILRLAFLAVAVFALWVAMWVGAEYGYNAWQSIPDPPDEAFSDTGPIFFLLVGWLPSLVILGTAYLVLRLCWQVFAPKAPIQEIDTSQAVNTVDRPLDDGNPYQSPGGSEAT